MNNSCLLAFFKKTKPCFIFNDNTVYTYFVIRIWLYMNISKTYVRQFCIMVYAEQTSARNKETSQGMIITLIVFASSSGTFTIIFPRHPSSRYWK